MRTPYRVDTSTLGWVKSEIDQTLGQAQEALQRYTETDDDVTPLRLFANSVHQVAGTLQMVELDGAARLAQETESLASAVVSGKIDGGGDSAPGELLHQGLSHLSDYMEQLARGRPDRPIDSLDMINELRRARHAEELDPYAFFHPDLEVYPSREGAPEELDAEQYTQRVRDLRRRYQDGLLRWLRDQRDDEAWQKLSEAATELFDLSRFQVSMQIWWVSRAYLDVLKVETLARDDARKHALAQLDQLMRKLIESGEAVIAREGAEKLVRYMLFHIGRSDARTDAVRAVVRLFELDTLLGTEESGEEPPAAGALAAIAERVMTPLRSVQPALDAYARSGERSDELAAAEQRLDDIAAAAREHAVEEIAELSEAVRRLLFDSGARTHSENALLSAAHALLFIEQTLEAPAAVGGQWRREASVVRERLWRHVEPSGVPATGIESREIDTDALESHELRRLVAAVAGQVEDNLKQAEDRLEQFSRDTTDTDSLSVIAASLRQVHGAVQMLGRHKLCDLLATAIGQIQAMHDGEVQPTDTLMDALAVTIGTTDAYVKGMERDAPNIDTLLARATQELDSAVSGDHAVDADPAATLRTIHESFDVWVGDNSNYEAFSALRQSLRDIGTIARHREQHSLHRIAREMTNLLDIVTDDPSFLSEEVEETLRRSLAKLSDLSATLHAGADIGAGEASEAGETAADVEEPAEADAEEPVEAGAADDEDDDIVRETFVEEAQECLQDIETNLQALERDHGDGDALTNVRRSFHTVKGSGRMAKAGDMAELAWIVEDTLNRCLDGTVPVSEPVVAFVDRARDELRALLKRGLGSSADLAGWRQRASSLHAGGDPSAPGDAAPDEAADGGGSCASRGPPPSGREEPALQSIEDLGERGHDLNGDAGGRGSASAFSDDEVIKIFSKEALSHIAAIRATVDECNRRGEAGIGDELLRAVHTLQGNARSLHLVEMSEAYTALDNALHARKSSGAGLKKAQTGTLDALLVATAKVLDHLNRDGRFPEVVRQELAEIAAGIQASWGNADHGGAAEQDGLGSLERVSDFVPRSGDEAGPHAGGDPAPASPSRDAAGASVFDELVEPERGPGGGAAPPGAADAGGGEDADALKDVFLEEATDILSRFETSLQEGRRTGPDGGLADVLKRELHTLKGSARAAGMEVIGTLSHDAETMLESVAGAAEPPGDLLETLEEVHDTLASLLQAVEENRAAEPDPRLVARLRGAPAPAAESAAASNVSPIAEYAAAPADTATGPEAPAAGPEEEAPEAAAPPVEDPPRPPGQDDGSRAPGARATVRIQSNVLDRLVNYAGEVSISRAQLEEQLSGLKGNLNELRANVTRFSDQVRELDIQADTQIRSRVAEEQISEAGHDFDPLEMDRYSRLQQLSRSLSESVDDLMTIQTGLNRFATRTEGVLSQQAMLNSELQDGLMSARMVPFNTLVSRLRHQARQTSRELAKDVEFTVTGGQIEVDRNILDQLSEALEHMIRNSLDHGIESAAAREAGGKPARGSIRIDCRQEGNEVLLKFSDDGAGLNVDRIKARAIEAGLLAVDSDLTGDEVIQLIVLSGFSTAESVTQLSGRGVGLDVVNDAVRRLGGGLTLDNRPGQGVTFELRLPLSLSITQAMFVRCGDQRFAIPLGAIETVMKTGPENLAEQSKDGDPVFRHDDKTYTLMDLTAALGLEAAAAQRRVPVLLVRMGAREVAIRVDELIETDEIVVKQLGDHLGRMSGISGATITGDGSVVLILDVAALWLAQERLPAFTRQPSRDDDALPRVMVVDDSLTVRKVTGRSLGRHGMEVTMARDGIDALDQMAQARPDLMLVDIEMPRMDGYELTSRIREDVNYRDIPIIVITSRAGSKHREKAMELGANAYLTKPYQERDLLDEVNALLDKARRPAVQ